MLRCKAHRTYNEFKLILAKSPYGIFPGLLGQFTSVTYLGRTGGKRLDKNRMHMRALLFEIDGLSGAFQDVQ